MSSYRRLIHEYKNINETIYALTPIYTLTQINNFSYKIQVVDSDNILCSSKINFLYKKENYEIDINYNKYYPFKGPDKLYINGINIFSLYIKIVNLNNDFFKNNCLCCKSLLCSSNWVINKTINDLIKEIILVIDYKKLYVKRILLRKIIEKYTTQDLSFMEKYLL